MKPLPCERFELKDLRYFVAVADASGIRRAAKQLGARQSVVSRRLRDLEDELGVSLFERESGGVRLTFAGSRLLEGLRLTFSYLDSTVRSVRATGDAGEGRLSIGVQASISSSFLNRLLRQYSESHPEVAIQIEEGPPIDNIACVVARRLDVTFVTGSPSALGCEVQELWSEGILAALQIDHPLATRASVQLTELIGEPFIVSRHTPGPEIHDYIVGNLSRLDAVLKISEHGVGRETLLSMVGLRFGITLISGAEAEVRYPDVVFVPISGETLPFSAIWSPTNPNPALRRFLSAARAMARRSAAIVAPSRTPDLSP